MSKEIFFDAVKANNEKTVMLLLEQSLDPNFEDQVRSSKEFYCE